MTPAERRRLKGQIIQLRKEKADTERGILSLKQWEINLSKEVAEIETQKCLIEKEIFALKQEKVGIY